MSATTHTNNFRPANFDANEQVALILCSSGTTGLPKGVMLTHKNLVVRFTQMRDPVYGILSKPGTTAFSILPMFHVGGIIFMLTYLTLGFKIVVMEKFSLELYLKSIQNYKVKTSFVAPPVMSLLAKTSLIEKYDLSSLKDIGCAGASLPKRIISAILKRMPNLREVRQAYGLTETTQTLTYCPRGDAKVGSLGRLVPFTQAKVIDVETKQALGPLRPGELCFKGDFVMKGYARNVTETENAIDGDGWFHTGDLGYYDESHHFYIVDRLKELIKYKGFQVSPAELEAILMQHPQIKDAAVIGIEDEFAGQLPRAYVVKQPNQALTELEVCDFVGGQVSNPKHLRGGVIFLDELPRISSGKVAKTLLRNFNKPMISKL